MKKIKILIYLICLIVGTLVTLNGEGAWAYNLTDCFTVSGFWRTDFELHTGITNPNNAAVMRGFDQYYNPVMHKIVDGNNKVNLFMTTISTDWLYRPSDTFKVFGQLRFTDDSTERVGKHVPPYDAFPNFPGDGTMMRWRDSHDQIMLRELYADISFGKLWLRIGKQQVVWGETDGIRLLDVFNSLDLTKHFYTVPTCDSFQDIRIPVFAIRGTYLIQNRFIDDLTVEGLFDPGDQKHAELANLGAPFNVVPAYPFPPFVNEVLREEQRQGELSGGGRLYGRVGNFNFTLNYLYTYNQEPIFHFTKQLFPGMPGYYLPFPEFWAEYAHPKLNIYGASFNYALDKLNSVVRGEVIYSPDQPYQDAKGGFGVVRQGTVKYVLGLDRPTFFLPTSIAPHAATLGLQFFQTIHTGDEDKLFIYNEKVDKTDNTGTIYISQPLNNDQLYLDMFFAYDFNDCYWLQPGVRYEPGVHWKYAVYGSFFGGADKRAYKFGALDFTDGVLFRIQYQFN